MTEQEYIETLPEDQQQYISHMREAMARSGVSTPESMTIAILLDGQVVPTDMTLAIIWQMNTPNYQRVARRGQSRSRQRGREIEEATCLKNG